jgi:hypothetical protein
MKKTKSTTPEFVICIDNSDYPASLELHKVYQLLPDERAAKDDFVRVIDESGEDYLYSADRFVAVELPQQVELSVVRHLKESTLLANKTTRSAARTRSSASSRTQKARARRG